MRLNDLKESLPGKKGRTTSIDAKKWLENCNCGQAGEKDMTMLGQLKKISKNLGGKTTVIEVLKLL